MVELNDVARLLDPGPLPLEMGVQRLPSGQLHVAARTLMAGVTGEAFDWWFRFAPDTEQYAWWHPLDHVSSSWRETNPRTHVGSTHIVQERLGDPDGEVHDLQINFCDPDEIFGPGVASDARARGDVSSLVCGFIGFGKEPPRDAEGRPLGARLAHIGRDTPNGMLLRSRFWLGAGLPLGPEELAERVPETLGLGLMQHAHTEFLFLARVLPALFEAENRHTRRPVSPW